MRFKRGRCLLFVVTLTNTTATNYCPVSLHNLAAVVHSLTTNSTNHSRPRTPGSIHLTQLNQDVFNLKKLLIGSFRVSAKLPLVFIRNRSKTLIGQPTRTLQSDHTHSRARFRIQERRRHLAVIDILQRTLAKPHARRGTHRIRHATINLNPNDQLLAIHTTRIVNSNQTTTYERHPRAEQLPRAHMAVQSLALN